MRTSCADRPCHHEPESRINPSQARFIPDLALGDRMGCWATAVLDKIRGPSGGCVAAFRAGRTRRPLAGAQGRCLDCTNMMRTVSCSRTQTCAGTGTWYPSYAIIRVDKSFVALRRVHSMEIHLGMGQRKTT